MRLGRVRDVKNYKKGKGVGLCETRLVLWIGIYWSSAPPLHGG